MLHANKIEILRMAGNLPKDAEIKYLLKQYKGCGAEALNTNNDWLFYMEEFYPLHDSHTSGAIVYWIGLAAGWVLR